MGSMLFETQGNTPQRTKTPGARRANYQPAVADNPIQFLRQHSCQNLMLVFAAFDGVFTQLRHVMIM